MSVKNSNDTFEDWTCDLACSAVPQPTALPPTTIIVVCLPFLLRIVFLCEGRKGLEY